jgi:polysaccharide export outer membrane protein
MHSTYSVLVAIALAAGPLLSPIENGAASQLASDDYRVGARDLLDIRVFGLEELDSTVRVTEDGRISLAMVGEVQVLGLTRTGVEEAIELALERYVNDPQVTVFVREFESQRVSVLGAVKRPGTVQMQGRMTLLEAISEAGGIDYDEAAGTISILREGLPGEPIEISMEELITQGNTIFNVGLHSGDTINVVTRPRYFIYVQGAVRNPGSFRLNEPITLLQAISLAGGLGDRAKRSVLILRNKPEGGQEQIKVDLNAIMDGEQPDLVLEPKDVIVVQESFF